MLPRRKPSGNFLNEYIPLHKIKLTKKREGKPDLTYTPKSSQWDIRWPPNSPDLNPVENYWAWLQARQKELGFTKNKKELMQLIITLHKSEEAHAVRQACPKIVTTVVVIRGTECRKHQNK